MGSLNFHFLILLTLISTNRAVSAECLFDIIYNRYFKTEITAPELAKVVNPRNPEKNVDDFAPKESKGEIFEPPESPIPVKIVDTLDIEENILEINQRENRTNLVKLLERIRSVATEIPKPLFIIAVIFLVIAIIFYYLSKKNQWTFSSDDTEQRQDIPSQVQSKSAKRNHCTFSSDDPEQRLDIPSQVQSKSALEGSASTKSNIPYLQKMVNEIKKSGNEDAEKYLTNHFLEVMSNYAKELNNNAEENYFSRYLTPEDLLQMGKYYHRCQSQYSRENQAELKTNVILSVKRSASTEA